MITSILTNKADISSFGVKGYGIISKEIIRRSEIIAVWGGKILSYQQLLQVDKLRSSNSVQINVNQYLTPSFLTDGDFVNHSCNPDAGILGDRSLIALRDIKPGEEITYDYAMTDSYTYDEFFCLCNSECCRKRITGNDWKDPSLQLKYQGFFSSYLQMEIRKKAKSRYF